MNQRTLLGRLLSPAGFALVLLFFLLPFVSVSCGAAEATFDSTFTGVDLVVGGPPDVAGPGVDAAVEQELIAAISDDLDLDPLALLAAIAVLAGMAAGLIRERLARHGVGTGVAVLAAALLTSAILRAPDRVEAALDRVREESGLGEALASDTRIRFGFWLTVGLLGALAVWHAVALARAWKGPAPAPPAPQAVDDHGS